MKDTQHNKRSERHQRIIAYVAEHGSATAAELAELTEKSAMTIHRDIDELAGRGFLRRFHGGVSAQATSAFESSSEFRMQQNSAAKDALARKALELIEPGMSVMLDDSTTVFALARILAEVQPLTVVSNFRPIADLFVDIDEIQLFMIGGRYSRSHNSFISPASLTGLDNYAVDFTFHSSSAMDTTRTYHQEQSIIEMKQAMLDCGTRTVLLMDSSKVGKTSLHRFAELSEFSDVILTSDVSEEFIAQIRDITTVHVAEL
ncbi:DeoR/GlpR family DNA-binding transcription regulator [Mycetocola spongiae]|uniref:DeoR/GlpR family DNA-binding transcription regulator n=1 Tax=Mycetocola spongiae TaxID=2859226 RepID=UPI001CF30644|nr:DeoR/GlpR family DNA-binding transcription regulator [Mycetocola spongiae]UCR88863.1 DeoR/GlpR family DNA-binding transcription regulator [Mycetocola spongiae]